MVKLSLATSELARLFDLEISGSDVQVSGVALSAQEVEPGDLFVAIQGAKHHGLDFLDQAKQNGALAVLSDRASSSMTSLVTKDPKALLGDICNAVLGKVEQRLFAVTGTNGKTSTASYLFQILERLNQDPSISGSTGMRIGSQSFPSPLTTAELTTTRKFLQKHAAQGGKTAVLEVSAQALIRHRVAGLEFEVAGFTNLSRDHLDDFESMQDYFNAKALLFDPRFCSRAVIFVGDDWSRTLAKSLALPKLLVGKGQEIDYHFQDGLLTLSGKLNLRVSFDQGELMARNLALALAMAYSAGFTESQLQECAVDFEPIPGRLERVSDHLPHTFVDYAHTPDGIASAVNELLGRYPGVTLVFGASGNRDKGKRPEMGAAAALATEVVLTDQHPRDENPAEIRASVATGLEAAGKAFHEVADPEQAFRFALSITPRDHALLWCGPGHLKYREIAGSRIPFDARAIAKLAVEES